MNAPGEGRYREWHQMQRLRESLSEIEMPLISIELDEHLREIVIDTAERVSVSWAAEGDRGQVVSLELHAVMADGRREPIDLKHLDKGGRVLATSARTPIVLPDGAEQLIPLAKARKREPRRRRIEEISNPALVLPEGENFDDFIDLSQYSDRVAGFEIAKPRAQDGAQGSTGIEWFAAPDPEFFISLSARDAAGQTETVRFETRNDAEDFARSAKAAVDAGATAFTHEGREYSDAAKALDAVEPILKATAHDEESELEEPTPGAAPKKVAKILELHETEQGTTRGPHVDVKLVPWALLDGLLRSDVQLKDHQQKGIAWLWGHLTHGSRGVLLADDMGLGKTLQVATLLALAHSRPEQRGRPHLVVCPSVLLANWERELERFFTDETFPRSHILHGSGLNSHRTHEGLDVERLSKKSLVITNYETLASYQLSLLRVNWATVVFDEAQWLKNETTLRARGAAGLKRSFGVAMTGTPVENRLSDVWALFDALEHGPPRTFGTRAEFVAKYEKSEAGVDSVRQKLNFPKDHSQLFRREKAQALRDLPPKARKALLAPMSEQQFSHERTILSHARHKGALHLIHQLQFLYQHPLLLSNADPASYSPADLLAMSPKLAKTCEELDRIHSLNERALVFTQFKRMQDILVRVFGHRYGISVPVINGDEKNRDAAQRNIDWFMSLPTFGVMVLSPIAAGVGLTITSANHVFHYGRWWNPAKEEQATDRVHRIGQTRPVTV